MFDGLLDSQRPMNVFDYIASDARDGSESSDRILLHFLLLAWACGEVRNRFGVEMMVVDVCWGFVGVEWNMGCQI